MTAFAGAARLDLATPAYGYFLGGGAERKDLWPRWNLGFDFRYGDKLARDNGLEGRSMGMSGDFETAIMLGATHVRVGTALFGGRR